MSTDRILTPFSEVRRTSQSHPRAPQEFQSVPRMRPGTSRNRPGRAPRYAWASQGCPRAFRQQIGIDFGGPNDDFGCFGWGILRVSCTSFHRNQPYTNATNEFSLHATCIFEDTSFDLLSKAPRLNSRRIHV